MQPLMLSTRNLCQYYSNSSWCCQYKPRPWFSLMDGKFHIPTDATKLSWKSCIHVLDISWRWPNDVKFKWHLSFLTSIFGESLYFGCTIWQPREKFSTDQFLLYFWILWDKMKTFRKKRRRNYSEVLFCYKVWLFFSFSTYLDKLRIGVDVGKFWEVWTSDFPN